MTDPAPPDPVRRWWPSYLQFRLTLLMLAIMLGVTGMSRNDQRLVTAAMIVGGIGVAMRFLKPRKREGA